MTTDTRTTDEDGDYLVVVNDEEQYSIWPADDQPVPAGWHAVGVRGPRGTCLDWIAEHWTDLRPRSLRVLAETDPARRGPR